MTAKIYHKISSDDIQLYKNDIFLNFLDESSPFLYDFHIDNEDKDKTLPYYLNVYLLPKNNNTYLEIEYIKNDPIFSIAYCSIDNLHSDNLTKFSRVNYSTYINTLFGFGKKFILRDKVVNDFFVINFYRKYYKDGLYPGSLQFKLQVRRDNTNVYPFLDFEKYVLLNTDVYNEWLVNHYYNYPHAQNLKIFGEYYYLNSPPASFLPYYEIKVVDSSIIPNYKASQDDSFHYLIEGDIYKKTYSDPKTGPIIGVVYPKLGLIIIDADFIRLIYPDLFLNSNVNINERFFRYFRESNLSQISQNNVFKRKIISYRPKNLISFGYKSEISANIPNNPFDLNYYAYNITAHHVPSLRFGETKNTNVGIGYVFDIDNTTILSNANFIPYSNWGNNFSILPASQTGSLILNFYFNEKWKPYHTYHPVTNQLVTYDPLQKENQGFYYFDFYFSYTIPTSGSNKININVTLNRGSNSVYNPYNMILPNEYVYTVEGSTTNLLNYNLGRKYNFCFGVLYLSSSFDYNYSIYQPHYDKIESPFLSIKIDDADIYDYHLNQYSNFRITGLRIFRIPKLDTFDQRLESDDTNFMICKSTEILNYIRTFININQSDANISKNPSYYTGSLIQVPKHQQFYENPRSYITTIGLYNDQNELLAIGKLSVPVLKSKLREYLFDLKFYY